MKALKIAALLAATTAASTATAGNITAPAMEPEIVVEEAASSSAAGWIVPLVFLAIIAIAASNDFDIKV